MFRSPLAAFLFLFLATGTAELRAEFPPDTFPDEAPLGPSREEPSYEESETKAADDEYLSPRKKRAAPPPAAPAKRRREGVSRQALPEEDAPRPGGSFTRRLRGAVSTGLTNFTSSNSTANNYISLTGLDQHFTLGLQVDFQFLKFFGADLDAYYAFTPAQTVEKTPGIQQTWQLADLGLLIGLRAEYPLGDEHNAFRPRLMIGYGIMNTTQTTVKTAGTSSDSIQVTGIYIGGGIEAEFNKTWLSFLDYSMSINTSAYRGSGGINGNNSSPAGLSGFTRLRIGTQFKIWGPVALGAMGAIRYQGSDVPADPTSGDRLVGEINRLLQIEAFVSANF